MGRIRTDVMAIGLIVASAAAGVAATRALTGNRADASVTVTVRCNHWTVKSLERGSMWSVAMDCPNHVLVSDRVRYVRLPRMSRTTSVVVRDRQRAERERMEVVREQLRREAAVESREVVRLHVLEKISKQPERERGKHRP